MCHGTPVYQGEIIRSAVHKYSISVNWSKNVKIFTTNNLSLFIYATATGNEIQYHQVAAMAIKNKNKNKTKESELLKTRVSSIPGRRELRST